MEKVCSLQNAVSSLIVLHCCVNVFIANGFSFCVKSLCFKLTWVGYIISILPLPASPGPVGNIAVTSTAVDQLTVTWTPPTTGGVPTSYNVTINDSSSPVVIADNGSPVYTHTFTGLISDTLYTVSVVAINCAGASNAVQHHRRTCKSYCVWFKKDM